MTQAIAPPLSFSEFLETNPDDGNRYELINDVRLLMQPQEPKNGASVPALRAISLICDPFAKTS